MLYSFPLKGTWFMLLSMGKVFVGTVLGPMHPLHLCACAEHLLARFVGKIAGPLCQWSSMGFCSCLASSGMQHGSSATHSKVWSNYPLNPIDRFHIRIWKLHVGSYSDFDWVHIHLGLFSPSLKLCLVFSWRRQQKSLSEKLWQAYQTCFYFAKFVGHPASSQLKWATHGTVNPKKVVRSTFGA